MWTEAKCLPTRCSTTECPWALQTHINNNNKKMRYKNKERIEMTRDRRVSKWERTKRDQTKNKNREKTGQTKTKWQIKRIETKRIELKQIQYDSSKTKTVWLNGHETIALANTHMTMHAHNTLRQLSRIFRVIIRWGECRVPSGTENEREQEVPLSERAGVCQVMPWKI